MFNIIKLCVVCVVLLVNGVKSGHPPEGLAEYERMLDTCVLQEGATAADREEMMNRLMPSTASANCLYTCVMEQIGVLVDGEFLPDKAAAVALKRTKSETRAEQARSVAQDCVSVKAENRCDMAMLIMACTMKAAADRGLNPNGILD